MNESLINPFNLTHPTAVQASLFASAAFARYDPSGRYLGVGRSNGAAAVWDLETRARIRSLEGHVKAVTSLDWSSNSRWIITSSKDWNVIKWDLASQCDPIQRMATIRFDGPVVSASFHPRNSSNMTVARFDPSGKLIFIGTSSGYVLVFNTRTKVMVARHKISGAVGTIKGLAFAKSGR
ncbi:hypothetical protein C0989_003150 [Termitomyces sp. Mn162]|nr:hypothetical protein C0989_003150 [Termitomyces sp. Mn162]